MSERVHAVRHTLIVTTNFALTACARLYKSEIGFVLCRSSAVGARRHCTSNSFSQSFSLTHGRCTGDAMGRCMGDAVGRCNGQMHGGDARRYMGDARETREI